jgi:signal transduction histidine kinase
MPKAMLTRFNLRNQLIASYLLLLAISLGVITVALFIFLSSRPAPPEPVYQRLAALLQGLNARSDVQDSLNIVRGAVDLQFTEVLDDFASDNDVRLLLVTRRDEQIRRVFYDSMQVYTLQDQNNLPVFDNVAYASNLDRIVGPRIQTAFGRMVESDAVWLFGSVTREVSMGRNQPPLGLQLIIAEPEPTASLQSVLNQFGSSLLMPIVQAGVIGLIVAVVLAWFISRSVVRPLHNLAEGAQAVARGDYDYQVPEKGASEMRLVAHAFNEMSGDVRASQQAQRDFLANVSHDLKTPLTSIQGYAQAILDGAARDPHKAANIIHDEAARLNRMVIQLTDLMRMQSGRLSLHLVPLDIGEVATAIGQRLSVVAEKKHIALDSQTPSMPKVAADGDRIAQVLTNLMSNAIKFTPAGGRITVQTRTHQGGVQIVVADTGIGIPEEDLPHIFDRFYQVDKARGPQRGSGLGLAITKEIIEAHSGTIDVHSDGENKGTTFTIWLPSPQLSTITTRRIDISET